MRRSFRFTTFMAWCLVVAALNATNVQLAWDASPETGVTGYRLWSGLSFRNYTQSVNVGNVTTGVVPNLSSGAQYHLAVTAYAGALESEFSNEVLWTAPTATPTPATTTPSPSPTPTPSPSPTATATVAPLFTISGRVQFCPNGSPAASVVVVLSGSVIDSAITDVNGDYQFAALPAGSYTITPMMEARPTGSGGINSQDTIAVVGHFLGDPLIGCAVQAADADDNGRVDMVDVVAIHRFSLGLPITGSTGQWRFDPATRVLSSISSNQVNQDFDGFVVGDVTFPFVIP